MAVADRAPGTRPAKERPPLWLDPLIQLRAFLPLIFLTGLCAVLLFFLVYTPLRQDAAREADLGVRAILEAQLDAVFLNWQTGAVLMAALLLAGYVCFYQTLHLIRPVYQVQLTLKSMAQGDYQPLRLAPRDQFRFLESDADQLNQKMKLIAGRNRDIIFSVHAHLMKLASRLAADEVIPRADLEEFVDTVRTQLEKAPEIGTGARH
ncbi:MAG: hypothetical protein ACRD35_02500 [Candidatus Acidiferrales bacterium]